MRRFPLIRTIGGILRMGILSACRKKDLATMIMRLVFNMEKLRRILYGRRRKIIELIRRY